MKTIKPEFDCVLEQEAPVRSSNSTLLLHNVLFIKILYMYHFISMNKPDDTSTNVTATRVCVNIVAVEKQ
jgi:hypothetical protein